ncbi:hypothetical protein DFJ58DRAFT_734455 [Suillus subalutaceus]|uniref:uncharacterized protein n=1 Tax=Suillus subalutaceus TaxID=48586 RepID=UPI001B87AA61|nr:uncharacterized protein DFJ58DRAFT_734455 [Suillus subalutaceus]KAG1837335.1 hypothetical protein DFJ58DRAFT_734455 [Suillus subalutaceus]
MAPTHCPEEYDPNRCGLVMLADLLVPPSLWHTAVLIHHLTEENDPNWCGLIAPPRFYPCAPSSAYAFPMQWHQPTVLKNMIRTGVALLRPLDLSARPSMHPAIRKNMIRTGAALLCLPDLPPIECTYSSPIRSSSFMPTPSAIHTFATTTFLPPSTTHDSALASRFINNNKRRAPPESSTQTSRETARHQVGMSRPPPSTPTPKPGMFYMSVVVTTAPYLHPQPDLDGAHDRDRSTKIPADSHRQTERVVSPQPDDYATPWIRASSARFQRPRKPLNLLHNPTLAPTASSTTSGGMSSRSASTSRRHPRPCL